MLSCSRESINVCILPNSILESKLHTRLWEGSDSERSERTLFTLQVLNYHTTTISDGKICRFQKWIIRKLPAAVECRFSILKSPSLAHQPSGVIKMLSEVFCSLRGAEWQGIDFVLQLIKTPSRWMSGILTSDLQRKNIKRSRNRTLCRSRAADSITLVRSTAREEFCDLTLIWFLDIFDIFENLSKPNQNRVTTSSETPADRPNPTTEQRIVDHKREFRIRLTICRARFSGIHIREECVGWKLMISPISNLNLSQITKSNPVIQSKFEFDRGNSRTMLFLCENGESFLLAKLWLDGLGERLEMNGCELLLYADTNEEHFDLFI